MCVIGIYASSRLISTADNRGNQAGKPEIAGGASSNAIKFPIIAVTPAKKPTFSSRNPIRANPKTNTKRTRLKMPFHLPEDRKLLIHLKNKPKPSKISKARLGIN